MVCAILDQPVVDDGCLRQSFPKAAQFEFALRVAQCLGYDLNRGRLDLTHHPFSTRLSAGLLERSKRTAAGLIRPGVMTGAL
jgi:carboxypeptidase Taq